LRVQATNSTSSFDVTTDGVGLVRHAGAALLRELADRLGLIRALGWHGPQGDLAEGAAHHGHSQHNQPREEGVGVNALETARPRREVLLDPTHGDR